MNDWDSKSSEELYRIKSWGSGYFSVNERGSITVRRRSITEGAGEGVGSAECDLYELVCSLRQRGFDAPILFRFDDIIKDRVHFLQSAFADAIREVGYRGAYHLTYPVKVNQQRHIVETILDEGRGQGMGLQVGSKAELLAVLAIHDGPDALLLCNGFKDDEYIELALMARSIGRRSILVIEQVPEVDRILQIAAQLGIEPELGLRMKPSFKGVYGESILTDKAKFGLSPHEIMIVVERLRESGKLNLVKLLHFHLGSQVTSIAKIKKALREACRVYAELAKICSDLKFFDVGGGLAIDYDGSNTNFESSMNYTVEEYARDVVYAIEEACRQADIRQPDIVSESGRALVAHHSVLVMEVIDVAPSTEAVAELDPPPSGHDLIKKVSEFYRELNLANSNETLHDALALKEEMLERFNSGDLSVMERGYVEKVLKQLMAKLRGIWDAQRSNLEELERLDDELHDLYFCNFSVFQSIPDSWAVNQLFPIVPIQRLNVRPTRKAIIADLTCDSDGKIGRFIDLRDVSRHVLFHPTENGGPYYVGIFLVGAYQEILGDLHNLFGDTHAVHVTISDDGKAELSHVVEGDRVREVLGYVQYDSGDLLERLRLAIEDSLRKGRLQAEESARLQRRYKEALEGYTYLVKY